MNNKGVDQPVHLGSLISTFFDGYLDSFHTLNSKSVASFFGCGNWFKNLPGHNRFSWDELLQVYTLALYK